MHYSRGFYINENKGNNAFSFDMRKKYRSIYVSRLEKADNADISMSEKIAFAEMEDDDEKGYCGIDPFLKLTNDKADIFIFDNHNHAFYFIYEQVYMGRIPRGLTLVHFDQHRDTRKPEMLFNQMNPSKQDMKDFFGFDISDHNEVSQLDKAFYYTNAVLNVGNFIYPLIEEGIVENAVMMTSGYEMDSSQEILESKEEIILDIDLDLFSEDMDYLAYDKKINTINSLIKKASIITICTSPFFVSFDRAKKALLDIELL